MSCLGWAALPPWNLPEGMGKGQRCSRCQGSTLAGGEGLPWRGSPWRGSPWRGSPPRHSPSVLRGCPAWGNRRFAGLTLPMPPPCRQWHERQYASFNPGLYASYISLEPRYLNCICCTSFSVSSMQNRICKYFCIYVNIYYNICKAAVIFTYAFSREQRLKGRVKTVRGCHRCPGSEDRTLSEPLP